MTRKICVALLFPIAIIGGFSADAQKVTVLKQGADQPQTVVEIDKDYVIVNGDTVARPGERSYRKIVIDREEDAPGMQMRSFGMGKPSAQKARLGVLTDPKESKSGAYIREVQPGSPAQAAGLKAGDVITAVDGASIADPQALVETISAHAPDDTVKIAYERDGKKRTATAYLEGVASEEGNAQSRMFGFPNDPFGGGGLGKMFEGMMGGNRGNVETPKIGVTVEERMDGNGVEATAIASGGVAEKAGLRKGDIITQLGDTKIDAPETLQQALREDQGKEVTLRYQRAGKTMNTKISLPKTLKKMDM